MSDQSAATVLEHLLERIRSVTEGAEFARATVVVAVLATGLALWSGIRAGAPESVWITPDGKFYQTMAANIRAGHGAVDSPFMAVEDYDPFTRRVFEEAGVPAQSSVNRVVPAYPLFLWLLSDEQGWDGESILDAQVSLSFLSGCMLGLVALGLWGRQGLLFAFVAALALGRLDEFRYAHYALLTEALAIPVSMAVLLAMVVAKSRSWRREAVVGGLMGVLLLTRPAFIFFGLLYGLLLLVPVRMRGILGAAAYGVPVAVMLLGWVGYSFVQTGSLPFANAVETQLKYGLRGQTGASVMELERQGTEFERPEDISITAELRRFASSPGALLSVTRQKLADTLERTSDFLVVASAFGFAAHLLHCIGFSPGRRQRGLLLLVPWSLMACVGFGWSTPAIQAVALLAPFAVLGLWAWREGLRRDGPLGDVAWPLSSLGGVLMIPLVFIGLSRYVRPFLPMLVLFATASVPLLMDLALRTSARESGADSADAKRAG